MHQFIVKTNDNTDDIDYDDEDENPSQGEYDY